MTPEQLEPGECAYEITITHDGETILVITIRELFCLDEDGVVVGGGGQTQYQVELKCPTEQVDRGDPVTCTLTTQGPQNALSQIVWSSIAAGHGATQDGGFAWSGRAVMQVTVTVNFKAYGQLQTRSAIIRVGDRGSNWENESGIVKRGPDVSPCNDWIEHRDVWGQTTHTGCHRDIIDTGGYEVVNGGGPWEGQYFVDTSGLPITLNFLLRPQLYDGGPSYSRPDDGNTIPTKQVPSEYTPTSWKQALIAACADTFAANISTLTARQVNVDCGLTPNHFAAIVDSVKAHEQQHVDSIMAVVSRLDLTGELDPLYGRYSVVKDEADAAVADAVRKLRAANKAIDHAGEYGRFWRRVEEYDEWHWYLLVERPSQARKESAEGRDR